MTGPNSALRQFSCALLIFCTPTFLLAAPLSLKEAIEYALSHSPDYSIAKTQTEITELQRKMILSQFLPSLDLSSNHGFLHSTPTSSSNDPWTSSVGLSLKENLYDNGVSFLQYDQNRYNRQYATLNHSRTRDQTSLNVITAFYSYSQATQNLSISKELFQNLEKQFLTVSDAYQQGFKTYADYLRLKTQVQRSQIELVQSQNQLANARIELNKSIAAPQSQKSQPGEEEITFLTLDPENLPIEHWIQELDKNLLTPESTYEYRLAQLQVQSNAYNIAISKRSYYPQLSLTAGGNVGYSNYLGPSADGLKTSGWNVMVTLNYNLFDWGLRRHQVETNEAQQHIQEKTLDQTRINMKANIDTLLENYQQLKKHFHLSKELVEMEKKNYELIRSNYREGKVQYLDLISSLNEFFSTKQDLISTIFSLAQLVAKYRYYQGALYDHF